MPVNKKLAVVCTNGLGWRTVRMRWQSCLPPEFEEVRFYNPETYGRLDLKRGFRTLSRLLTFRRAANHALKSGFDHILVATNGESALLPTKVPVKYFIYGDAGTLQFRSLYLNDKITWKVRHQLEALTRLGQAGHQFFTMSHWAKKGFEAEYAIPPAHIHLLPPPIDLEIFHPRPKLPHEGMNVLFLGGDFDRKGGELVLELAEDPDLTGCHWHVVTKDKKVVGSPHMTIHRGLQPQSEELLQVIAMCDVLALPTKADCSSLAALEALAMGIPVIITDVGGISDIVTNGFNGFLMEKANVALMKRALMTYIECPQLLHTHAKNGYERICQENALPVHAKKIAEVVEKSG